jgi:hypothetical protein
MVLDEARPQTTTTLPTTLKALEAMRLLAAGTLGARLQALAQVAAAIHLARSPAPQAPEGPR